MRRLRNLSDVVDWRLCVGCGACVASCKRGVVRLVHVEAEGFRPVFDEPGCAGCTECMDICAGAHVDGDRVIGGLPKLTEADHEFGPALAIYEGWASDAELRYRGSSGGVLSALSLYCLERGGFAGVVHAAMDESSPWMNFNYVSRNRAEIVARAGSRYCPSAPCAALRDIGADAGAHVFIGKPCDAAAVTMLAARDAETRAKVGLILTFFCAGTPSTRGTLELLGDLGTETSAIKQVHYRGEGWPGDFRVIGNDLERAASLPYRDSWAKLAAHNRPLRCNLCPDGLGRVADIACGDAWHHFSEDGDPGRSLILLRTERGRQILAGAVRDGYLTVQPATQDDVLRAQPSLLERRRTMFGRAAALTTLGAPIPRFAGFSLFRSWIRSGVGKQANSVVGTLRRGAKRGWYRRERKEARTA